LSLVSLLGVQQVAQEIKGKIEEFKPFIPLIQGLRNPGMRSRHWDNVRYTQMYNSNLWHWNISPWL